MPPNRTWLGPKVAMLVSWHAVAKLIDPEVHHRTSDKRTELCAPGRIVCAPGVPQPGRTRVHVGALAVVLPTGVACEIAVAWTKMGTET